MTPIFSNPKCTVAPWNSTHDRQLVATVSIATGETIVMDTPLVAAPTDLSRRLNNTWRLVELLLADSVALSRYYSWKLKLTEFPFDREDTLIEALLAKKYRCGKPMVRRLYNGVATNNIGYVNGLGTVTGHALYETLSRANHSCAPNARLGYGDVERMERTIVAVRDIPPGESITWNYGGVNLIPAGYVSRNMTLAYHFRFACFCDRCRDEMPDNLRGQPDLFKYFQIWLTELEKPVG